MTKQQPTNKKRKTKKINGIEIPNFENDSEMREFLAEQSLILTMELIEIASKKNNIRNPTVSRAKQTQYKTALDGLKTTDTILKNKQLDDIQQTLKRMEENLITINLTAQDSNATTETISNAVAELNNLNKELDSIKEVV